MHSITATAVAPGMLIADKYRVERVLGQGAMGVVVSATHLTLQQTVAIKVLRRELVADTGIVARFLQEARAQARIQGDHVVRVLDVADFPEVGPAIVMEFLAGEDLQAHVDEQGPLAVPVAVDFVLQAAEALAQAHSFGLVHRDLKPQNLFLSAHPDGSPLIKVLDFGISKVTLAPDDTRREGLTTGGSLLGSPQYMSPEQITDPRGVTHKSDLWSLGVILYELLTAKMPFDGQNVVSILTAISLEEPRDIREHRPDLPQGLADTVMRCLQKVPAHRPGDIAELAEGLVVDAASEARANRVAHIQRRYSYRPGPPPSGVEEPLASALRAPRLPVLVPSVPPPSVALPAAAPPAATRASDPGQLEWASPTVVPPPPVTGRKRRAWARASMAAAAGAAISFSAIVGVRWVPNHAFARSASPPTGLVAPPPPPVESAPRLDIPEPVAVEVAPLPTPAAATPDAAAPQRIKPKPRPAPAKVAEPDSPPADAPAPAPVPAPPAEATPPSAD